jgi:hypothetical protein
VPQAANAQSDLVALQSEIEAAGPALEATLCAEQEAGARFAEMAGPLLRDSLAVSEECRGALARLADLQPAQRSLDMAIPDLKSMYLTRVKRRSPWKESPRQETVAIWLGVAHSRQRQNLTVPCISSWPRMHL